MQTPNVAPITSRGPYVGRLQATTLVRECERDQAAMEELLCVGGPCAGQRVPVPHEMSVVQVAKIRESELRFLASGQMLPMSMMMETHLYERAWIQDQHDGNTSEVCVLAYTERRGQLVRELIAGYARAFSLNR